ncbi:hypothetical protein NDU88_004585 [Pleurodeles waltl]|uniref:Uncharacterized protein n=1 Tax=Pleurodeles waltl TaxID=8319 RepID=A0AAV7PCY3_PLEWA|nr:hypothetical protein NDU88_004585 [Pleurodeles waltl]
MRQLYGRTGPPGQSLGPLNQPPRWPDLPAPQAGADRLPATSSVISGKSTSQSLLALTGPAPHQPTDRSGPLACAPRMVPRSSTSSPTYGCSGAFLPSTCVQAADHQLQAPSTSGKLPRQVQTARLAGPALPSSALAPCQGGRFPPLRASQLPRLRFIFKGELAPQTPPPPAAWPLGATTTRLRKATPAAPEPGVQDRHDLGRRSSPAPLPIVRRRPPNPCMPRDEPGETRSSVSSRLPLSPAWPRPPHLAADFLPINSLA